VRFFLKPGNIVFIVIALLPLFIAFPDIESAETESASGSLNLLGRASGMLGLSLLLLAAIQAVRIPGLDRWFGGLTTLWKVHHVFGAAAFLLLMVHPLLLVFAAAPVSPQAPAAVLFPALSHWSLWAGWLALLVMMSFLAPTFSFFGRSNYQRWKALHAASGLTLILALAHALPLNRSLPGPWEAFWVALGSLSVLAFIYRVFPAPRIGRKPYKVTGVKSLASGVVEMTFEPENRLLRYRAGQFVYLTPLDPKLASGRNEEHPYTLSSAPQESALRIVIKDAGDATHALQNVSLGSKALIEGPYGEFLTASEEKQRQLWIAGGIGLTPFLSYAWSLVHARRSVDIYLIYCAQDESRAYFLPELEELASKIPGFRVCVHYFYREGALAVDFISARCPDFGTRYVYLCGPPPMIESVRRNLVMRQVPRSRLHSEDFTWL
jgi:predicted ferric reductase